MKQMKELTFSTNCQRLRVAEPLWLRIVITKGAEYLGARWHHLDIGALVGVCVWGLFSRNGAAVWSLLSVLYLMVQLGGLQQASA